MNSQHKVLIIEDDPSVGQVLLYRLKEAGYVATLEDTGTSGYERARTGEFDALVLDIMLPGMDGFDILKNLREEHVHTKILMLTAKVEFDSRVQGLEAGADDYLSKPFDYREVILRIRNLLATGEPASLVVGDITLDKLKRSVERAGITEELTEREYELLLYVMERAGEVISKETLLAHVWKSDFEREPNIVNVYISYLRKKLERKDLPQPIETVHGAGIKLHI